MNDQQIHILLIEATADHARLICDMLSSIERSSFACEWVDRLSAGLEQLAAGTYDVVLLDLALPDSQGFETFVRLHGRHGRTPILVLTELDDQALALRAMQAGAQDCLAKGQLSPSMLARAILYAIERKRAEQAQRFLAETSTILNASLDYTSTLDRLAQLAIPNLADWCAVHMLEADGTIQRLAVAHVDPAKAALARERTDRYPLDQNAQHLAPRVLRSGQSEIYPEVPDALLIASARDAEHLELLRQLGFKSYICVPLVVHGATFGALTLAVSESGRRYNEHDLALAEELARRAAIVIDNARLYRVAQEEIAERIRMEATLRASEERLADIVGSAMDAIISIDETQHILLFNAAAERIFRCPAATAIGQLLDRFIPTYLQQIQAEQIRAFGQSDTIGRSMRLLGTLTALRADGEEFPIEATISQTTAIGQNLYTLIIRDITARKSAEQQLRHQAELLEHVSDAILVINLDFMITSWNRAAEVLYGWRTDEAVGQSVSILQTAYVYDQPEQVLQQFWEQGIWKGEVTQMRKDGSKIAVLASVALVRDSGGTPTGMLAVNHDITAWRQAEERFAKAFRASPAALSIVRRSDGCYIDVNTSFCRLVGYSREELIGNTALALNIFSNPAEREELGQLLREQGHIYDREAVLQTKSGELRSVIFSTETIELASEASILVISIDITERKRLEAQFLQAQKMESIGRLAGGVAHDFNNLLTAINGYAELALRSLPATAAARGDLEEIMMVSEQATTLTSQLLAFARKRKIEPQVLQLNNLISTIDKLLRRLVGSSIELVTWLETDLGQVKADPGQLEQVLVNLAINARDAMPRGGKLTIETRNAVLDHDYAQQHLGVTPGPYVLLAVSDTGGGMDAETQAQIFEPFFTTKGPDRGTGLGLATCYGIIKQHGGHIWLSSELEHGTTFKIYLPQTNAAAAAQPPTETTSALPRGAETVLLAEDDVAVRGLAARVLRSQGYTVLEAIDSAMALRLASEHSDTTIDLLLIDTVMPQISGQALIDQINIRHPHIKALFMSGYPDDAMLHHGRLAPDVAFLQKPFSPSALARKVREVLDRRG